MTVHGRRTRNTARLACLLAGALACTPASGYAIPGPTSRPLFETLFKSVPQQEEAPEPQPEPALVPAVVPVPAPAEPEPERPSKPIRAIEPPQVTPSPAPTVPATPTRQEAADEAPLERPNPEPQPAAAPTFTPPDPERAAKAALLLEQQASDPPGTGLGASPLAPSPYSGLMEPCPEGPPADELDLAEAVTRALCNNPRTRYSWAAARAQAARVGIERAGFLPAVSAWVEIDQTVLRETEQVTIIDEEDGSTQQATLSTSDTRNRHSAGLAFTWLLFDFGQGKASQESARQTLLAATAMHQATVQELFLDTATAWYALVAAQTALSVERRTEQFSHRILAQVDARIRDGMVSDVDDVDMLQARSTAAEATLARVRAEGRLRQARGALAVLLGLPPDTELSARDVDLPEPGQAFVHSIKELLKLAREAHPAIQSAQAAIAAARANVNLAARRYRPTLSLVQENLREQDGIDRWENRISLQLSIPLYDPARRHREREARADLDAVLAEAQDVEQAVALEVWSAFQDLTTESMALDQVRPLMVTARQLLKAEQDLYESGDGDMLDLIYAQQSVASASWEYLDTLASWRIARLRLAASLGRLGFWNITAQPPR